MSAPRIRPAVISDIDALDTIEKAVFPTDRISRRSFRTLIDRPTAETLVAQAETAGGGVEVTGYAMILFRAGAALARLYSLAVAPGHAGRGIGRALLAAAEKAAMDHDRILLRLEVREDNVSAIALYKTAGYRRIGRVADYYADGMAALRFEKLLRGSDTPALGTPFYEQSTDFTCGSACLLMALARYRSSAFLDPVWEIRLWREATTVFMLAGPGGCEPFGLAMVARDHGLDPEVWCSTEELLFLETVRDPEKHRVMELAQRDFRARVRAAGTPVHTEAFTLDWLRARLAEGHVALILVSGYLMMGKKVPHWVLAHGDDGRHIFVHDPWVEDEVDETAADAADIPVPYAVLDRIARFGRSGLRAAVLIKGNAPDV
ncbi:GCN5 family acetyltransferase [Hoeflea sp. BAL378]|uniref:GNAT family N-acetyltransferase/peptidase C39 family protein n=1 Tax=Hoeflea sp. BAL378 TaxID=1547437 RepID=UPI0005136925|nr:GNAT family N-acetyltransferase/peptidase C39 family protein [Hoeflea sp. BAL378]KGF67057.1 GCN5 family acetyltransferase [Hoeflea sp. BAL378]